MLVHLWKKVKYLLIHSNLHYMNVEALFQHYYKLLSFYIVFVIIWYTLIGGDL